MSLIHWRPHPTVSVRAFARWSALGGRNRPRDGRDPSRGFAAPEGSQGVPLVVDRAEGTRRLYAVDVRGLEALRSWLDGFWDEALAAFKEAAERETKKQERK